MKLLSLLLVLLAGAAQARAQDCCRIEGVVRAANGAPLANADVMLALADAKNPRLAKTDAAGRYVFEHIAAGIRVEVRVVADGRPIASGYTLVTSFVETLDIRAPPESTSPGSLEDLSPMGGESGEVRGVVRSADGTPIPGAHVTIGGALVDATTDSRGRYSFGRLRSKLAIPVQVTADGFDGATQEIAVPAGGAQDADFTLAPTSSRDVALGLATTVPDLPSFTLKSSAVAAVPGTIGFDLFGGIRLLPAVGAGADDSELSLHGGAPGDSNVTLDGMTVYAVPRLAAGFGPPFSPSPLQQIDVTDGPFDGDGGGRLAGLVRVTTMRPASSHPTGTGELSLFGPSGSIAVPVASVGSAMLAVRRSWPSSLYANVLDRFAGAETTYLRTRAVGYTGGVLAASPQIGFSALNGRIEIAPARGNRAYVSFYRAGDDSNLSRDVLPPAASTSIAAPQDSTLPSDAVLQIGDVRSWTGRGVSGVWERRWSADVSTTATIAQTRYTNAGDQAYYLISPTAGSLSSLALRGGSEALSERNEIQDTTGRLTTAITVGFAHAIEAGVEHTAVNASYAARGEAGATLVPLLNRTTSGAISSAFVQDVWRPTARLTMSPGIRLARTDLAAATTVDPRATASFAAAPHVVLKGSWSIDHQSVNRIVREDLAHGDGVFWTLSDGSVVPVARARQATAGVTVEIPGVLFDAHAYYRRLDGLSMFAPRLLPGAALAAPAAAFYTGSGTSTGVELLVQYRRDRNTLWASYAGGRADYAFPTLITGDFPASFERQHQMKIMDSARVAGPLSVTAAYVVASGLPYTPATGVQEVWFSSGALSYAPAFGDKNSALLPVYQQLDISGHASRRVGVATATVGLTVFNVLDRRDAAGFDFEAGGPTAVNSETLLARRAANIFFRVGF